MASIDLPVTDYCDYRYFKLNNGMKVLLVRDARAKKSSCALSLAAGASFDPAPGLAHLTEHAVFLGSERYPDENDYKDFLSDNGGGSNGATAMEYTSYKFYVDFGSFAPALDRFIQFFVSPCFRPEDIGREVQAVDAEDSKNRVLDYRRRLQLVKCLMRPSLSYSKFSTGNVLTLTHNFRPLGAHKQDEALAKAVRDFHAQFYHPAAMNVVLAGPQSLDELEGLARGFDAAPVPPHPPARGQVWKDTDNPISFGGGHIIHMKPIDELRDLTISWPFPEDRSQWRRDPASLLSLLFLQRQPHSLHSQLLDRGWITSLSAGKSFASRGVALFELSFQLSAAGEAALPAVLAALDRFLAHLHGLSNEHLQSLWRDMHEMSLLGFEFSDQSDVYDRATFLASQLLDYDVNEVYSGDRLLEPEVNMDDVREALSRLQWSDCLILLRSPSHVLPEDRRDFLTSLLNDTAPDQIPEHVPEVQHVVEQWHEAQRRRWFEAEESLFFEPFYGIPFARNDSLFSLLHRGHVMLGPLRFEPLQAPNPFLPTPLLSKIRTRRQRGERGDPPPAKLCSSPPRRLSDSLSGPAMFHSRDQLSASQPRSYFSIFFPAPQPEHDPTASSLLLALARETWSRRFYQASVAGLGHDVDLDVHGLTISVAGFTDQLPDLLSSLLRDLDDWSGFWEEQVLGDEQRLQMFHEKKLRMWRSWRFDRPDHQATDLISFVLQEGAWWPGDLERRCEDLRTPQLHEQALRLRAALDAAPHSLALSHGEADEAKAEAILRPVLNLRRPFKPVEQETKILRRARRLPEGQSVALAWSSPNESEENSAYVLFLQLNELSARTVALSLLMRRLLAEPAFSSLRTQSQLGYIVSLSLGSHGRGWQSVRGLELCIVSKRFDPRTIHDFVTRFLDEQRQELARDLTQPRIDALVASLVETLRQPANDANEEFQDFWSKLRLDFPFDWSEQVASALQEISLSELQQALNDWVFDAQRRKAVVAMVFGPPHRQQLESLKQSGDEKWDRLVIDEFEDFKQLRDSLPWFEGPQIHHLTAARASNVSVASNFTMQ